MNNTMKLEQQVTSLELSKKLKELGVAQDSLFYWDIFIPRDDMPSGAVFYPNAEFRTNMSMEHRCSAFTVAELGEMLPLYIMLGKLKLVMAKSHNHNGDFYSVGYFPLKDRDSLDINLQHDSAIFFERNEADARAKMLIWLIEEGYITQ